MLAEQETAASSIPKKMQALVLTGVSEFSVQEVDVPEPGPYEVLCRVKACAICGTDPHIIEGHTQGRWPRSYPFIPGHEWSGVVVKVGDLARGFGWQEGERVAGTSHAGCGFCRMCTTGRYNLCENYGRDDIGHRQYGHYTNGAFAEYVVHSIRSVHKIPDSLPFDQAALVDTASIALHTLKRPGINPGDIVVTMGPGPMGILTDFCARALGAARTIIVGRGERLARAAALGAEVVDYSEGDPVAAVKRLTGGKGADVTADCAGTADAIRWSIDMVRRGGKVVLTGVPLESVELPRSTVQHLVLSECDIYGVRANRGTCEEVIPMMAAGRLNVAPLITHHFPLARFAEAYEIFTKRIDGALKVIIEP
jgi:L-iditol 2-dehydrogenase